MTVVTETNETNVKEETGKKKKSQQLHNKKTGALYVTMRQLAGMFYVSRFNRDNMHDLEEGEDIDNSRKHRIYNKGELEELMVVFGEFFEWAINKKNLQKVYISKGLTLERTSVFPRIKYASGFDAKINPDCVAGEYYITKGKYHWDLWLDKELYQEMQQLWLNDPAYLEKRQELIPELEEKNRNAKSKNTDKSS